MKNFVKEFRKTCNYYKLLQILQKSFLFDTCYHFLPMIQPLTLMCGCLRSATKRERDHEIQYLRQIFQFAICLRINQTTFLYFLLTVIKIQL